MYSKNIYLHKILRVLFEFDFGPRLPGKFSTPIHYDAAYSEMIFNVITYSKKGPTFQKGWPLSFSKRGSIYLSERFLTYRAATITLTMSFYDLRLKSKTVLMF